MNVEQVQFPLELKNKLTTRVNKPIKTQFFGGSNITTDLFNVSLIEPFKVVFTRKDKNVVVFIISKVDDDKTIYDFFVGDIDKTARLTMTATINFVNANL